MTDPATLGLLAARHTLRGRGKSQELFVPYIRQRDLLVSFLTNRLSSHDFPVGLRNPAGQRSPACPDRLLEADA